MKKYSTPKLRVHGSVETITKGQNCGNSFDNDFANFDPADSTPFSGGGDNQVCAVDA